jgi:flagellar hook-associated protein 1
MPSTFYGMEIGRRALNASQMALNVVSHNTANVNTPGYSRQVVAFSASDPYTVPNVNNGKPGQLGTGVNIDSVNRIRDVYLDGRVNASSSIQGALGQLTDILGRVEQMYFEPGVTGIGQLMTDFFHGFSDLAATPESAATRATVRNRAQALVSTFNQMNTTLRQVGPEVEAKVADKARDVTDIAAEIASLNKQIRVSVAMGEKPNDLMDQRGTLINKLSGIVDVQTVPVTDSKTGIQNGEVNVLVNGFALVQNDTSSILPATMTTQGGVGLLTANGDMIPLRGGEIYGLIQAGTHVEGYLDALNTLASNVITAVNTPHLTGYGLDGQTGRAFFSGTGAGDIALDITIQEDLKAIAASTPPLPGETFAPGNGDNARALSRLAHKPVIGSLSLNEFYNGSVAQVGADQRGYELEADNQRIVAESLKSQQSAVSGVSLDEELTNMLQFQRTYQAAARVITIMDETLDRVINGMGATR